MFLKDHLKAIYYKASLDKDSLVLENIINIWAHRFGVETLNDLKLLDKVAEEVTEEVSQEQINLTGEDYEEENREQVDSIEEVTEEVSQEQINLTGEDYEEENREQVDSIEEVTEEVSQEQINLIEQDCYEINQQGNLILLENEQKEQKVSSKSNHKKILNDNQINYQDYESSEYKGKIFKEEKLPLPNINNLRKWINSQKKAS